MNNEYVFDDQFVASYHIAGVIRCIQGTCGLCHMSMLSAVSHIHIYMVGGKIAVRENKQTLVHSSPPPQKAVRWTDVCLGRLELSDVESAAFRDSFVNTLRA